MNKYKRPPKNNVEEMTEAYREQIVQRITRNLLDVQILRLIQTQPMWGYIIKKRAGAKFGVQLRHGALYPLLNTLEKESFLTCQKKQQRGRTRKVYTITRKGTEYIESYYTILREQLEGKDLT